MTYSGVYVFGDSLVDAGNALKLAQWYGTLTFSDLPDGAPSSADGYYAGRFTNGYTFADLLANKAIGQVTDPVFPFGYEDPWLGIPISPFGGDPDGNNLNFAYGGAQIRQGDEVVPDLDGQVDAFINAVDGDADPNALYIVTIGGNDVRSLVPGSGDVASPAFAHAVLDDRAGELVQELTQLIATGATHILITGMADVGLVARYDANGDNQLGGDIDLDGDGIADVLGEASRSALATEYSQYLDNLIRTVVVPTLEAQGATVTYVPIMDHEGPAGPVTGALSANLGTLEALNGLQAGALTDDLLTHDRVLFFDGLHPTAQAHALLGAFIQAELTDSAWVETMPLLGADVDYKSIGTIATPGQVGWINVAVAADTTYTFEMLGVSSLTDYVLGQLGNAVLPTAPILGDPSLRLLSATGALAAADDDSGAGFDSSLTFHFTSAGLHVLQLSAVGELTGSYVFTAGVTGAATLTGSTYTVNSATTLVIEGRGWAGVDTVQASVSYKLAAAAEIEILSTTNAKAKTAINLTGNDYGQAIIGNAGNNVLEGKGGIDELTGGAGKDVFVLGTSAVLIPNGSQVDRILDYGRGDLVDLTQVLQVAQGTDVLGDGYLRVTSSGKIQVDLDGGDDEWVTLSTVNGNSPLSISYLHGGGVATATIGRTAETALGAAGATTAAGDYGWDPEQLAGHAFVLHQDSIIPF